MSILSGVELLGFVFIFTFALAASVPLTGTLVRYRASYNPRGLALDAEGGAAPYTGPVVSSYFGMMARVYRIEGWAGLYKGFVPTLLSGFIVSVFVIAFMDTSKPTGGRYNTPDGGPLVTFVYSVFYTLVSLPAMTITYRAIITPYRLPSFNPSIALRVLLTPTERSRPWTLYLTPGLLATQAFHVVYVVLVMGILSRTLLKTDSENIYNFEAWRIGAYLSLVILSTIVLTPLEVIYTRLAIQRNHDSGLYSSTQETEAVEDLADFYGDSEDVIGLRSEGDPYMGMMDCAKRIIDEEGVRALYRGWWVTALGGLMKA